MAAPTCRDFATGIFSKAFRSAAGRCRLCRDVFANTGKKVGGTFKYYLTAFGRRVTATGLKLREMAVIPLLRGMLPTAA
jgi:hypothetical protein